MLKKFKCGYCKGAGYFIKANPVWLKRVRRDAGISLVRMAKKLGITNVMVYYLETGKKRCSERIFRKYRSFATLVQHRSENAVKI